MAATMFHGSSVWESSWSALGQDLNILLLVGASFEYSTRTLEHGRISFFIHFPTIYQRPPGWSAIFEQFPGVLEFRVILAVRGSVSLAVRGNVSLALRQPRTRCDTSVNRHGKHGP